MSHQLLKYSGPCHMCVEKSQKSIILLHWKQCTRFGFYCQVQTTKIACCHQGRDQGADIGQSSPTTYESNFIHHDFVQFGKQHSWYKAILLSSILSQQCCEAYFIFLTVAKLLRDLTTKYYWNCHLPNLIYWLDPPLAAITSLVIVFRGAIYFLVIY